MTDVRFGAHCGLKSDIARGPKSANNRSSIYRPRSHLGTTSRTPQLTALLYSLDKRRSPLTIEDGAPRPVGANVKREWATRGQAVALSVYARRFGASVQRQRTVLTLNIPFAGNVGSILPLSSRGSV